MGDFFNLKKNFKDTNHCAETYLIKLLRTMEELDTTENKKQMVNYHAFYFLMPVF